MDQSVFVSKPRPFNVAQREFANALDVALQNHRLAPRTLGITDFAPDPPLAAIRRLMLEANGLICIAFRRNLIEVGETKPGSDEAEDLGGRWQTSPWPHIEVAMAFQLGLPILILRERGVIDDGVLEKGVTGTYLPQFDLDGGTNRNYFEHAELRELISTWVGQVRSVVASKGTPPRLY